MVSKNPIKDKKPANIDINKKPENHPVDKKDQNNKQRVEENSWQPMDSEFPGSSKEV